MKLLKKTPEGGLQVVPVENLRGIMDAFEAVRTYGDGEYIADSLDGSYLPFKVVDGQPVGGFSLDGIQYGSPYEKTEEGQRFRDSGANSFPSLVPDVVGTAEPAGNAWEDYPSRG